MPTKETRTCLNLSVRHQNEVRGKQFQEQGIRIRSYSGPHFPAFRLNTDQNNFEYEHFLRSGEYLS